MSSHVATDEPTQGWPHFVAVILVCVTFPLIWAGGLVTTYDAGMAVPDWPTTYGHNMFLYPISTWWAAPWDLFIEHGHRLLGSLAGIVTIALNVAIWKYDSRRWMRWVGAAALVLVVSQGLLGGMRVRLNESMGTELARAHGCTGPLFFATSVAICVMTSKFWFQQSSDAARQSKTTPNGLSVMNSSSNRTPVTPRGLVVSGWVLVGLAYLQLVLGAHLRHPGVQWSPSQFRGFVLFHVVVAILLLLQAFRVTHVARKLSGPLKRPSTMLVMFVFGQIILGFATWRAKYGWPSFLPMVSEVNADQPLEIAVHNAMAGGTVQAESMSQSMTVTAHVALGSLILATSVCLAMRVARAYATRATGSQWGVDRGNQSVGTLEGRTQLSVAGGLTS